MKFSLDSHYYLFFMRNKHLLFGAALLVLVACGGEEKKTIESEEETTSVETDAIVDYNIPSPSDQFSLIADMGVEKNTSIMHDAKMADKYTSGSQKALNFGGYTADIAYLTAFNETDQYLSYFGKLEKLGNDIGIAQVFGTELGEMAKKWDGNADSLFRLSDKTYNKAFRRLIEIDKGTELSLMLVGGWVESMHLMIGSSKGFGKSAKLDQAIADQKVVAENLLEFLFSYKNDKNVALYISEIEEVLKVYEGLQCSSGETNVSNNNGKLTFSGGEKCKLTEKCFKELSTKIGTIRKQIITI